jgi:hypothetical protein
MDDDALSTVLRRCTDLVERPETPVGVDSPAEDGTSLAQINTQDPSCIRQKNALTSISAIRDICRLDDSRIWH